MTCYPALCRGAWRCTRAWGLVALAVQVEANGQVCPTAAQVHAALEGMLDTRTSERRGGDAAVVESAGGQLTVRVRDQSGAVVGERRVNAAGSCDERARTAAVVIAALETRLPAPTEPVKLSVASAVRAPAPAPPASPPAARELELTGLVASTGESVAPGGRVDLALLGRAPLVLRAAVSYTGALTHKVGLGPGAGRFSRAALAVGAGSRNGLPGRFYFESGGEAVASALRIEGTGFMHNRTNTTFDPGLRLAARLGRAWSGLRLAVTAGVGAWLRPQKLYLDGGSGETSELPRFEVQLGLAVGIPSGVTY